MRAGEGEVRAAGGGETRLDRLWGGGGYIERVLKLGSCSFGFSNARARAAENLRARMLVLLV